MGYQTITEVKEALVKMIPAAARHNSMIRPNPIFMATRAMIAGGEHTLIAALFAEIDETISRDMVETALRELAREGRVTTFPESAQGDLTEYDRMLALRTGGQDHHWVRLG